MAKNSHLVLSRGNLFYKIGKILLLIWAIAIGLMILTALITLCIEGIESVPLVFVFDVMEEYEFTIPIVILIYLGLLIGSAWPAFYISGLHLIGLGQIAVNTDKE